MRLHRAPLQQNKFANDFLTCTIELLCVTENIPGYTAAFCDYSGIIKQDNN